MRSAANNATNDTTGARGLNTKITTGKSATAVMEARDTYRNKAATARKMAIQMTTDLGARRMKDPSPVATPLPPRNFSQTGKIWPTTENNAAAAAARISPGN